MDHPQASLLDEISMILHVPNLEVSTSFQGWSHEIFVIVAPGGQKWSLRRAKNEFAASMANRSSPIVKHISNILPMLSIPAVVYNTESYSVLTYIEGTPLMSWNSHKLSDEKRHRLLDGLASFLYQLWTCPAPATESNRSTKTYRDWLLEEVDKAISRSINNPSWGHPIHFFQRRARVDGLVPPQDGLGLAIKHGDLNAVNILKDDDKISGIIDWDTASFVPAQAAIQYPEFMADIPGYLVDDVPEGMNFADDRAYLVAAIRQISTDGGQVADLLASSCERQYFEMSLRNKRINEEYIKMRLNEAEIDGTALAKQLNEFLAANTEMKDRPVIQELQKRLTADCKE